MPGMKRSGGSSRKNGDESARAILGCGLMILAIEEGAKLRNQWNDAKLAVGAS